MLASGERECFLGQVLIYHIPCLYTWEGNVKFTGAKSTFWAKVLLYQTCSDYDTSLSGVCRWGKVSVRSARKETTSPGCLAGSKCILLAGGAGLTWDCQQNSSSSWAKKPIPKLSDTNWTIVGKLLSSFQVTMAGKSGAKADQSSIIGALKTEL